MKKSDTFNILRFKATVSTVKDMHSLCFIIMLFCVTTSSFLDATATTAHMYVRLASMNDMEAIIALDTAISYEHFTPIFLQYPEFEGKEQDVQKMLADEVEADTTWFTNCIAMVDDQRLYVAYDDTTLVGFVACHKQDDTIVVIDLLMIDAECRGKGIGRQLIQACIQTFPEISACMLVVLDKNRQACAAYEKMGFVLMTERPSFIQEKYPEARYLCYGLAFISY